MSQDAVGRHAQRDVAAEKAALRTRVRAARASMMPAERSAAARGLRDAVLSLPEAEMAGTVAA